MGFALGLGFNAFQEGEPDVFPIQSFSKTITYEQINAVLNDPNLTIAFGTLPPRARYAGAAIKVIDQFVYPGGMEGNVTASIEDAANTFTGPTFVFGGPDPGVAPGVYEDPFGAINEPAFGAWLVGNVFNTGVLNLVVDWSLAQFSLVPFTAGSFKVTYYYYEVPAP